MRMSEILERSERMWIISEDRISSSWLVLRSFRMFWSSMIGRTGRRARSNEGGSDFFVEKI